MLHIKDDGTIRLTRGDTARLTIPIINSASNSEYIMQSGDVLFFTVKKSAKDTNYLFQKKSTGTNSIHIKPEDTDNLSFGKYKYDAKLTSSTRFTQIRWHIYGGNSDSQRVKHAILKLYFNQYTMQAIGDGVADASVSDASPYQGDTVIFSAVVPNGEAWLGWYSDPARTILVSTDQSYSVSPESDLTLYAKATKVGSGVYLKRFGAYSEASSVYKKQNGVWSTIDKSSIDQTKKYELIQ